MDTFFKASIIIILTVLLTLTISKTNRDFVVLIVLAGTACLIYALSYFLEPIVSVVRDVSELADVDNVLLEILLKVTGVAVLSEFVILLCNDSGNTSMGKGMQMLSSVVILWLSLPLFTMLLDIIKNVLDFS